MIPDNLNFKLFRNISFKKGAFFKKSFFDVLENLRKKRTPKVVRKGLLIFLKSVFCKPCSYWILPLRNNNNMNLFFCHTPPLRLQSKNNIH